MRLPWICHRQQVESRYGRRVRGRAPPERAAGIAVGKPAATPCAIAGAVRSGATPLPGVALTLRSGDAVVAATSTDIDGTYRIRVAAASVPAAGRAGRVRTRDKGVTFDPASCQQHLDLTLTLASRVARASAPATTTAAAGPGTTQGPRSPNRAPNGGGAASGAAG